MTDPKIIYTYTDEAPALATYSFLPIVRAFAAAAGVPVVTKDISLTGRILAQFPERLTDAQRVPDDLTLLGNLTHDRQANIVKLPNISASIPQLKAAIAELQAAGYDLPNFPDDPQTDEDRETAKRYDRVKGSAVNPVLREGNSDRRAPASVKNYARKHPHYMGAWSKDSKTNVATMGAGDFAANELSVTMPAADSLKVELHADDGTVTVLRPKIDVLEGEIIDATRLDVAALDAFLLQQVQRAKQQDILFSAHLKATMMKVSDPIIFGHVVRAYFKDAFQAYGADLEAAGLNADDGLAAIFKGLEQLPNGTQIRAAFDQALAEGPRLAMVDSDRGITTLHVPSDVIIDASMPAMIRDSGHMWAADGKQYDALAVIPDSSYAGIYQATIDDCRANGALDPATMGSVPNVGLMAQKAEEYGSHDKTFQIPVAGSVKVIDSAGKVLLQHQVGQGDIWRACQTKDVAVRDWVKLAVNRGRATGDPVVFWLDQQRAHDQELIKKVHAYLKEHDTDGLDISILSPTEATKLSLQRIRQGKNTISVTGNVLRDYLTDLFPILELGTSAKMLSIVPLLAGGGLFETGAGGSAPRHVAQLTDQNYLRWDSLGEFLALAVSFEQFAQVTGNAGAQVLADTLDAATGRFLEENRSPGRKIGTIDNRGSHYYLALYWADELAKQSQDAGLAARFTPVAQALEGQQEQILKELIEVQGSPVDIGGYYFPDPAKTAAVMRPSVTLNGIIDGLVA